MHKTFKNIKPILFDILIVLKEIWVSRVQATVVQHFHSGVEFV